MLDNKNTTPNQASRRDFLKLTSMASLGLVIPENTSEKPTNTDEKPKILSQRDSYGKGGKPKDNVRIGFIGTGLRGRNHLEQVLLRKDCEVIAICDIDPNALVESQKMLEKAGKKKAAQYGEKGEQDYHRMLEKEQLDAVLIASPWEFHSEQSITAMKKGIYVGSEVCGGFSIDECWELVNAHEATGSHMFFLENVNYRRDVMAVLNMVRQKMFGEILHLECGYQHDLRGVKFNDGITAYGSGVEFGDKGFSESKWRTKNSLYRNAEMYPTHGIGPVAMMVDINRGNRFMYLTSTASKSRSLHEYIVNHPKGGKSHPNANLEWKLGDVITTVLKCNNGETIILSHDTNSPRPYSLGFRVQGTKGIWMDVNKSLYLEGTSKKAHSWENADDYLKKNDHPLWQRYAKEAEGAGHGGMDFFVLNSFIECVKRNEPAQIDVYDAATWLAITPLSEASIATGSMPQAFPDFTRGRWMKKKNDFAVGEF